MANKKISQLDALGTAPASTDILPITDVSGTPTTKSVTVAELLTNAPDNSTDVTLATVANNYLTLSGQEITAGIVPVSLGGTGSGDLATARANLGLGDAATKTVGTADGNVVQLDATGLPAVDGSQLLNLPAPQADVQTPLNEALRGTANPHIGAYPNQPFNVLDNPARSVMVITNSDGELDFLIPDGGGIFLNSPTGGRLSPSFGFSVVEDANEPDIEVASGGENYSVISGDSDSLALNGLPIRQGFNNPDIGANASPILISGGSIA